MNRRVVKIDINGFVLHLDESFEKQGLASIGITGLSSYGEHFMGIPGNIEIEIELIVLPGFNPSKFRREIYEKIPAYETHQMRVFYNDGFFLETLVLLQSVKNNIHEEMTTFELTLIKYGPWYGDRISHILDLPLGENNIIEINGVFECKSPVSLEIIFKTHIDRGYMLQNHKIMIKSIETDFIIEIELKKIATIIDEIEIGDMLRIDTSLDYSAIYFKKDRYYQLPILGKTKNAMISTSPLDRKFKVEYTDTENEERVESTLVFITRETFLVI